MKNKTKKEKNRTITHKSTPYIQKIEWEKRRKRKEEIREQAVVLQQERMMNRVTESEVNPPDSVHDRQEQGIDEDVLPMDVDLWIEMCKSLQLDIPQNITLHSPSNLIQSA